MKLRREIDETALNHESQISALKKKSADAANDLNDQIEQLQKVKTK